MRRPWPRTLAGQLVLLLLLALFGAQLLTFLIFADERRLALLAAGREQVIARTAALLRLLRETPEDLHPRIVRAASGSRLRFAISSESLIDPGDPRHRDNIVVRHLRRLMASGGPPPLVLADTEEASRLGLWRQRWQDMFRRGDDDDDDDDDDHEDEEEDDENERMRGLMRSMRDHPARLLPGGRSLVLSVALGPDRWLNVETVIPAPALAWAAPSLLASLLAGLAISFVTVLALRRTTRPLKGLARAADAFGRGLEVAPLEEKGPAEIRQTVRAFNLMQERLKRFVEDRTRMLAAIGHDLRTPITSLRIRAEFVEDEETRAKIVETLDEMQRMVEAALAFLREEAATEPARTVDLAALVESLVADCADIGWDVTFRAGARPVVLCRPDSLRRALRNLIENAVRYGTRAKVALERERDFVRVVVEDEGPGIPPGMIERAFEPFFRLEGSRSRETGGIGLGLAIVRTIARSHGGDLYLANRPEGGLRATLQLPV